eukprot:CAMPEP_0113591284 /NCGR_PEP_ID=MMETSP0015_2-20120614/37181_1 /TAXON_ID=2838 /ORGANISM="Odontella" /LENGTH=309 /DNA_ID=CAMNT_0000497643 /DNA_START=76 /DNA_END=1005 /DNA_ORIENTATION=- /assembly_acc=CAM_ASM_000160
MSSAQSPSRKATNVRALSTKVDADWTSVVPSAVRSRNLACTEHTVTSADRIRASLGAFCDGTTLSLEVEDALFEAFLEDDYDGKLHLTTLDDIEAGGAPIGLIFWREVPDDEMEEWLDFNMISTLQGSTQSQRHIGGGKSGDGILSDRRASSVLAVRQESVRWLTQSSSRTPMQKKTARSLDKPVLAVDDVTHAWVKIELLAVRKEYWGRSYGTLLLACALLEAYKLSNNRAVLHVAGGKSNVPAVRLYSKFGFLPVERGTVFQKPDKDLYVLGNIGRSLEELAWSETLDKRRKIEENGEEDSGVPRLQ